MSGERGSVLSRGEELLATFRRGMDFTRELLLENERLRRRLAELEDRQQSAARHPEEWEKLRLALASRIEGLEHEQESLLERLREVEAESREFAARHASIEEENDRLANLYVASCQLHSTLEVDEVLRITIEIALNLIGADAFAIYLLDERAGELRAVTAQGLDPAGLPGVRIGEGRIGACVAEGRAAVFGDLPALGAAGAGPRVDPERPLACVPLRVDGEAIGALAIFGLLPQKCGALSSLDHELLELLASHAATALLAARLYAQSERKRSTLQGFIELLTR